MSKGFYHFDDYTLFQTPNCTREAISPNRVEVVLIAVVVVVGIVVVVVVIVVVVIVVLVLVTTAVVVAVVVFRMKNTCLLMNILYGKRHKGNHKRQLNYL